MMLTEAVQQTYGKRSLFDSTCMFTQVHVSMWTVNPYKQLQKNIIHLNIINDDKSKAVGLASPFPVQNSD